MSCLKKEQVRLDYVRSVTCGKVRFLKFVKQITGILGLNVFSARNKVLQAEFVLVKFFKLLASENLSKCYAKNGLFLKILA